MLQKQYRFPSGRRIPGCIVPSSPFRGNASKTGRENGKEEALTGGSMISLNVNGREHEIDVPGDVPLLWVLRDHLKLTGTKYGCGIGACGSCTVHVDGKAVRSCGLSAEEVKGKRILTIEGLPESHPVKRAWIEEQVVQCGYCQPGVMMQVAALLAESPKPDPEKIIRAMDDVICRCGTYPRIKRGIRKAVQLLGKEG
jgi:isoquinoline 1-oxidoreductase alpha subunit